MKADKRTIAKHARLYIIALWGILSLLYVAGEPIDEDMTLSTFCLLKLIGLVSLGLCYYVGMRLHKAGMLPEADNIEDCEK